MIFSESRFPPRIKCEAGFFGIMLNTRRRTPAQQPRERIMAKGQARSNKEKKKPKAEWNKDKKKGGREPPRYMTGGQPQLHNQDPFAKKS